MLLSALSAHLDDVDANVDAGVGVGVFRFVDVVADVDVHDVLSTATLFQVFANLLHFFQTCNLPKTTQVYNVSGHLATWWRFARDEKFILPFSRRVCSADMYCWRQHSHNFTAFVEMRTKRLCP